MATSGANATLPIVHANAALLAAARPPASIAAAPVPTVTAAIAEEAAQGFLGAVSTRLGMSNIVNGLCGRTHEDLLVISVTVTVVMIVAESFFKGLILLAVLAYGANHLLKKAISQADEQLSATPIPLLNTPTRSAEIAPPGGVSISMPPSAAVAVPPTATVASVAVSSPLAASLPVTVPVTVNAPTVVREGAAATELQSPPPPPAQQISSPPPPSQSVPNANTTRWWQRITLF